MKKIALVLGVTSLVMSAANANITTGIYIGATFGLGSTTGKYTASTVNGYTNVGGNSGNIGLYAGYGVVTNCLYFGGEVGYTFENSKFNNSLGTVPGIAGTELKRNGYVNAAARAGYLFTPNTMLYISLGARLGKWNFKDAGLGSPAIFNTANVGSGSKNRLSFAPGIGLETAVHKNVYLRIQYTYEFGPNVQASNSAFSATTATGTLRNQSGQVGIAYKF